MTQIGRTDRARRNLDRLDALCGGSCPEYRELRTAIERLGSGSG